MQTQVLPYIREIMKDGVQFTLLTFEPKRTDADFAEFEVIRQQLDAEGIDWQWLPYHKRFSALATAWDVLRGALFVRSFISRERPDILHCRIHVPMLMGAVGRKLSRHKPKLLFDIRGFFPEEYTDAGIWPENGFLYRSVKRVESWLMKESDAFVVLTEKAREILFPDSLETGLDEHGRPVEVIPCCMDIGRFEDITDAKRSDSRGKLGIEGRQVIAYVGSFGGWYLSDEMMDLYAAAREADPNVFALILTQRDLEKAADGLRARGFGENDFLVRSVEPPAIADHLAAADVALSFIKACYSKLSSSPTKLAEYLASGLPIISNRGVGDVDDLILNSNVGVLIDGFDKESYLGALSRVRSMGSIRERCRRVAEEEFDLASVAGKRYRRIYQRMIPISHTAHADPNE